MLLLLKSISHCFQPLKAHGYKKNKPLTQTEMKNDESNIK